MNRKLRQTLLNLLTFDDTLVTVIGSHFSRQATVEQQTRALVSMIETACLLRQLRNFYALNVVMGALQSLPVYRMTDAWRHLHYHMHVHYRYIYGLLDSNVLINLTNRTETSNGYVR